MRTIISAERLLNIMFDDLKPCPFCGGTAKVHITSGYEQVENRIKRSDVFYSVECDKCYSKTMQHAMLDYVVGIWNKRIGEENET